MESDYFNGSFIHFILKILDIWVSLMSFGFIVYSSLLRRKRYFGISEDIPRFLKYTGSDRKNRKQHITKREKIT